VLTPAEWRILHFVRHGLSNRQLAARFGVSLIGDCASAPEGGVACEGGVAQLRNRPIGRSRCAAAARRTMHEKERLPDCCALEQAGQRLSAI